MDLRRHGGAQHRSSRLQEYRGECASDASRAGGRTCTSTNSTNAKPQLAMVTLSLMRMMRRMPAAPSLPGPDESFIACAMAWGPDSGSRPRKSRTGPWVFPMSRVPSFMFVGPRLAAGFALDE